MERNVFSYSSRLYPFLHWYLCHTTFKSFENNPFTSVSDKFQCFFADRDSINGFRFLCDKFHKLATIIVVLNISHRKAKMSLMRRLVRQANSEAVFKWVYRMAFQPICIIPVVSGNLCQYLPFQFYPRSR